jgi:hypothetical protein
MLVFQKLMLLNDLSNMPRLMTHTIAKMHKPKPLRYLWPIAVIVSFVTALWAQFPWNLKLYSVPTESHSQRIVPQVAYITIDEASINQLVKRAASEWMLGSASKGKRRSIGLDLTTLDTSLEAPPPIYLDKGSIIPTDWRAEAVAQAPVSTPSILSPETKELRSPIKNVSKRDTLNARLSTSLIAAKFQFQFFGDALKTVSAQSGQCRFYIECNATGEVEHILRLSTFTQDTSIFERALMLGKAKTSVAGWVDIEWMIRK